MAENKHPYNEAEIARVRRLLELSHRGENPQAFEIFVDGSRIVPRTTKLELFDEAMQEMLPEDFELLEVKIYYGSANANDNHQFFRSQYIPQQPTAKAPTPHLVQPYSGQPLGETTRHESVEEMIDRRMEQRMETERAKMKVEQLQSENNTLKEEIRDQENYIAQLENALLEAKNGAGMKENIEGLVNASVKVMQAINGVTEPKQPLGEVPHPQQNPPAPYEEETQEEVSDFEKYVRELIQHVNESFNAFHARMLIDLLNEAATHPNRIIETLNFIRARIYGSKAARHGSKRPNKRTQQKSFEAVQPSEEQENNLSEEEENEEETDSNQ